MLGTSNSFEYYDSEGFKNRVIQRRKRVAATVCTLAVLAAVVCISAGVAVTHKKHTGNKAPVSSHGTDARSPSPAPVTNTSLDSALTAAEIESMDRQQRQWAVAERITPALLESLLEKLLAAAAPFSSLLGAASLPDQLFSSKALLLYVRQMNVVSILDALADLAEGGIGPTALEFEALRRLLRDVQDMLAPEAFTKLGAYTSSLHRRVKRNITTIRDLDRQVAQADLAASPAAKHAPAAAAGRKLLVSASQTCTVVPVVFHIIQYRDRAGKLQPSKRWAVAAQQLVNRANYAFSSQEWNHIWDRGPLDTFIRFRAHQVRTDTKKYPYLLVPYSFWASCASASNIGRMNDLTWTGNADVRLHTNVYLCGSPDVVSPWGYAYVPRGVVDAKIKNDHVFLASFQVDSNNADYFWEGGWTFAHELGHYWGLHHTHDDNSYGKACIDGDGFTDTPVTKDISTQKVYSYSALYQICDSWRMGTWPTGKPWVASDDYDKVPLSNMSSCRPNDTDPVFNVMSYTPQPCSSYFSRQQVHFMRKGVKGLRPWMWQKYRGRC